MKRVVSHEKVIELWYNQTQDNARTSNGCFYFEKDTIYSFGSHFPIAKHVEFKGKKAVLFTKAKWGSRTSKHISWISNIIGFNDYVLDCYDLDSNNHKTRLKSYLNDVEAILEDLLKCRKVENRIYKLISYNQQVNHYCEFYELDIKKENKKLYDILNFKDKELKKRCFDYISSKSIKWWKEQTPESRNIVKTLVFPDEINRLFKKELISTTEKDSLLSMIKSNDVENLTLAIILIEQLNKTWKSKRTVQQQKELCLT